MASSGTETETDASGISADRAFVRDVLRAQARGSTGRSLQPLGPLWDAKDGEKEDTTAPLCPSGGIIHIMS